MYYSQAKHFLLQHRSTEAPGHVAFESSHQPPSHAAPERQTPLTPAVRVLVDRCCLCVVAAIVLLPHYGGAVTTGRRRSGGTRETGFPLLVARRGSLSYLVTPLPPLPLSCAGGIVSSSTQNDAAIAADWPPRIGQQPQGGFDDAPVKAAFW